MQKTKRHKNKNLCATFAVATAAGSHRKRAAKKMTSKYEIKLALVGFSKNI